MGSLSCMQSVVYRKCVCMVYYLVSKNPEWLWLYLWHSLLSECHLLQRWSEILAAKHKMSIAKWENLWHVWWQHKARNDINSEPETSVVWGDYQEN